jgi:serine/threonine-protein kinase
MPVETESNVADRLVGTTVGGRYRIVSKLGEGGMGAVYVGEQQMGTTVRKVAVKTLHPHLSHDPKILARFERECGTVAELTHPNTIQVFDFGRTDDGLLYIVMEFIEGKSIASILKDEGPLSPVRVDGVLAQVCGSLAEAHGRGIVHRDLKPENVVLCERAGQKDWVKVLDFGIAKRSSEEDKEEAKLTQQGTVVGTPPYMSPEQFTGKPIDARSDIYSLAVMTYEMLTGRLPFAANTAWEWAAAHMTLSPLPIDDQLPSGAFLTPGCKATLFRGLAKNPDERFATAAEFMNAFRDGLSQASSVSLGGYSDTVMAMGSVIVASSHPPPMVRVSTRPVASTTTSNGFAMMPGGGDDEDPAIPAGLGGDGSKRNLLLAGAAAVVLLVGGVVAFSRGSDEPVGPGGSDAAGVTTAAPTASTVQATPGATSGATSGSTPGATTATTPSETSTADKDDEEKKPTPGKPRGDGAKRPAPAEGKSGGGSGSSKTTAGAGGSGASKGSAGPSKECQTLEVLMANPSMPAPVVEDARKKWEAAGCKR